ncbi:hypothetical protein K450DRAFT_217171 [Umbelopsis ramanniana AG]|uniref:Uncharacterized protein n=1 Tax=Umbelopsis ramanniana AG TaxID=1314678 RepID=A0AAD5EJJ1_UMBRA|nr:uncharacterized protein K450DRAFT_217171 [Umbelopsis ramanniana AG]KAI8584617.1 hypothetical protein K450DRAFT_217171 [Umbelopsis ramanniana AG]
MLQFSLLAIGCPPLLTGPFRLNTELPLQQSRPILTSNVCTASVFIIARHERVQIHGKYRGTIVIANLYRLRVKRPE